MTSEKDPTTGWIDYDGSGSMPIPPDTECCVWLKEDGESEPPAHLQGYLPSQYWNWKHRGEDGDIIKYKLKQEYKE